MNAMGKTPEGRIWIAAAAERLDFTVSELGQQHRADLPQGEITRRVAQHQPEQGPPTFLPMNESEIARPTPERESVEAPSHRADEPGAGETHDVEGSIPETHGPAGLGMGDSFQETPGMEVDMITVNDADLKEHVKTLIRDAKDEVLAPNKDIMIVVRALGGISQKYRRERSCAINVVSEVYVPPRVIATIKLFPELKLIPGFALDLTTADVDGSLGDFDSKIRGSVP